jgi:hypothetical protein
LKEGDALSPLLFNFALEYAIRRVTFCMWCQYLTPLNLSVV